MYKVKVAYKVKWSAKKLRIVPIEVIGLNFNIILLIKEVYRTRTILLFVISFKIASIDPKLLIKCVLYNLFGFSSTIADF